MAERTIAPLSIADGETDLPRFAQALGESFGRTGFAVISDHGISEKIIGDSFDVTRRFFALPEDVKRQYLVEGGAGPGAAGQSGGQEQGGGGELGEKALQGG